MRKKKNIFFTVICFQITVFLFAQTELQKQMMYEYINRDSKVQSLIAKIKPITNKEMLFENAKVLPVFHVELNDENHLRLIQNKNSYLVLFDNRVYVFFNDESYMLFENRLEVKNIYELIRSKKEFSVAYFTNYNYLGETFNILLTDNTFSFLLVNDKKYANISDYIEDNYGSFEKYKEHDIIEKKRDQLTLKDIAKAYKVNYLWYEKRCPKDTTLIINKFIEQIKTATSGFTTGQQIKLQRRIKDKLNPSEYIYNKFYKMYDKDLKLKSSFTDKTDNESTSKNIVFKGKYDISIYNVNITQDLLELLTNKQFQEYKNYLDLFFPIVYEDNLLTNERYTYGIDVYKKELDIKVNSKQQLQKEYSKYFEQNFGPFDCPFDETIKREIIIR